MFKHCLRGRGGGGGGGRERQRKNSMRCSYNDRSMYSKFSTFRPKFDKCPEVLLAICPLIYIQKKDRTQEFHTSMGFDRPGEGGPEKRTARTLGSG